MGHTFKLDLLDNRFIASGFAVLAIWFFAFFEVGGEFAGLILWQLFGTTNQLLAGLALLAITIYLLRRGKPLAYTILPMALMLLLTLSAMTSNLIDFWTAGQWMLLITGGLILALALWLTVESGIAVRNYQRNPSIEELEIDLGAATIMDNRSSEEKT